MADPGAFHPADRTRLVHGTHRDPHAVLGAHPHPCGTVIRTLRPTATAVSVRIAGIDHPLTDFGDGLFGGLVPVHGLPDHRLVVSYPPDRTRVVADGYCFPSTLGELDLHLFGEGRHERLWEVLGAHPRNLQTPAGEVCGTSFAVWAPRADAVSVIGDLDGWSGHSFPMRALGSSGIWEVFIPDIGPGELYKYRIHCRDGSVLDKADPFAASTEVPPATASRVWRSGHLWRDDEWLARRASADPLQQPMSIYEVHLGSWRPGLSYAEAAEQLVEHVRQTGFTHVELLPVTEHPYGGSWGYQVTSYYAPTSRFGGPDDFRAFVDRLHRAGIGVLLDWVPGHFPKDDWALGRFDGAPLYEHADPRRGEQNEWGTYVFDYGRPQVRNFLVASALFWLEEFHVDGLRVDAVASMLYLDYGRVPGEWEPNVHGGRENLEAVTFLRELNEAVHRNHRGVVTIAEESTTWPGVTRPTTLGGLGFTMKWNMGWMHDLLGYLGRDPVHRTFHHHEITFSLMYAWTEYFLLPISHDEVVHGKGSLWTRLPGEPAVKAAQLRGLFAFMWAHPGKQLLFMGQEYGQVAEWSEQHGLDWGDLDDPLHRGVQTLVGDLNRVYRSRPALWSLDDSPGGFAWIDANDTANNVLGFLRYATDGSVVACLFNFSGRVHRDHRVGLPEPGRWDEVLNTDAGVYCGGGHGNFGGVEAETIPWHGRPASAAVVLPAHGAIFLVRRE
ncbi:1,4-alpha-glucan branching protein GlgB [Rhodococcus sp. D2-41]|uniref:1,4-alpha-glucan branching enzyme GlgB n=1 Tax=Speluncibacter jeojiensis TaxID=2710754 RepID=A0A9X4RFJ9_9ACTN|nr:1,4-alpha-glucan branching protein GlgB [Rhodococcus sp. D2-41]MDG3012802.1 1,4-alpha-glucan branching protein GlgB [Rhodococcus sp. D2-41]MDG3017120.1 1,4-alpha-glucan branching protein GlgB [Corynebacteriales bacterium D3-21]